ncbi:sugar phosphate isomerase/epimerase family protein [Fodinicola feengrottensis]|uniref:Sugar phosphate isomerase/epimerase n=1 Tax=Fodinicola feengrottensis TaxID=435914 RepID=A0ABN2HZ82_9ACTN|nr:sugar phosphate isomerase/epimerase family protein [Fodinicola feengrottensis]
MSRLSINQQTVKQLSLPELIRACTAVGVDAVGLWREPVAEYGLVRSAELFTSAGFSVTSLCRGGFFTAADPADRRRAIQDNRAAIDETAALGAPVLVLVAGGLPAGSRDLRGARAQVVDAIAELAPYAAERGVRLAIEPLHPMFTSDRCVVSTLAQSLDIAEQFPVAQVGVCVDTYHLWWDPDLDAGISRAGERIAAYQLADWTTPLPAGVLTGRGQIGDGCVDFPAFTEAVLATGYTGPIEVEIFNDELWKRDGAAVVAEIAARYPACVGTAS